MSLFSKQPWLPLLALGLLLGGLLLASPETFVSWFGRQKNNESVQLIADLYGKVEKRHASSSEVEELSKKSFIAPGDILTTHQDSKVLLHFSPAFWLMPFSKIELVKENQQWIGRLIYGEIKKVENIDSTSKPEILLSYREKTITELVFSSQSEVIETPLLSPDDSTFQDLEEKDPSPQTLIEKQIFQTLQLHKKFFQTCFVRLYKNRNGNVPGGETLFDLLIDVNGSIETAKVIRSDIEDKEYQECLQSVFARMRFKNFLAKEPLHALFPIHVEIPR